MRASGVRRAQQLGESRGVGTQHRAQIVLDGDDGGVPLGEGAPATLWGGDEHPPAVLDVGPAEHEVGRDHPPMGAVGLFFVGGLHGPGWQTACKWPSYS